MTDEAVIVPVMLMKRTSWNGGKKMIAVHGKHSTRRVKRGSWTKSQYQCLREGCGKIFTADTFHPRCPTCDYGHVRKAPLGTVKRDT